MISCVAIRVMSWPSKRIEPLRARGLPQIVIISVVLPAPLAPISVTISPSADVEVDALQRLDLAVEGLDASDLEQRRRHAPTLARSHARRADRPRPRRPR